MSTWHEANAECFDRKSVPNALWKSKAEHNHGAPRTYRDFLCLLFCLQGLRTNRAASPLKQIHKMGLDEIHYHLSLRAHSSAG